ncbi:hypothetical protein G9C85_08990 [Halorubellus sp. JP-L1]|uniref:hypothetical protein n=1 Tax=Halorubellus sp. JP-L1 TaxID=2715753 RepID=UPI00140C4C24|nr:hypothetical protein [Halorubellus sp. JP-L1]NHN41764.1 hypothetical protein [Halorubellus sp. JP-L1]
MDENVDAALRFAALQLALVTAAIHLWIGWQRLFVYLQAGTPFIDPLQVLFVLSSLAVLAGVGLAAWGVRREYVYALGIVLMLTYLLGWVFMGGHRTGGGLIAPAWETAGHAHGSALATLFAHLFEDWRLVVTKVVEATALVVLVALLYGERTTEDAASTDGADAASAEESDASLES